jgi:hypothetical protein
MFIVFYPVKIVYICVFIVPHPAVFVTHLWIHGMYVCMYVYIHGPSTGVGQNNGNSCEGYTFHY